jgi:hypothetical protein
MSVISKKALLTTDITSKLVRSGMSQVNALIDLALRKGSLHDSGHEMVGGKQLRHIQAVFNRDAFNDVQGIDIENATWPRSPADQYIHIADTTDFWIDDSTGYIYQVINQTRLDPVITQNPAMIYTLGFHCSAFNQPVTIQIPAHATPVSSINQIPARLEGN